jgi:hypothetical protein
VRFLGHQTLTSRAVNPWLLGLSVVKRDPLFGQIPNVAELISDWATQIHADTARRKVSSVGQCPDSLQEFPWFEECAGGRDLLLTVMVPILTD